MVEIEVKGLRETQRALYTYSQQLGDKVVLASLRNGARVIVGALRNTVPVRTGRLKRAIRLRPSKIARRRSDMLGVYITFAKGRKRDDPRGAYYAHMVNNGWTARNGRRIPGQDFVGAAFERSKQQAVAVAVNSIIAGAEIVRRRTGL